MLSLLLPAAADTVYSNFQNITIPTDFTGVTVSVAGGTINPFFGGVGVANNNLLQPLRVGTGNLDKLLNLSVGSTIDVSSLYLSAGSGGSVSHLGSTFTAGQEGYFGFKLNAADYGWMRVVFTGNTAGAVIEDWANDNSSGQYYNSSTGALVTPSARGAFTLSGNTLAWTAVPEPTSAVVGLLPGAGLLRRRRAGTGS